MWNLADVFNVKVTPKNDDLPEEKLHRCYIVVIDSNGKSLVRRRSVILKTGLNSLVINWSSFITGYPAFAVLYKSDNGEWGRGAFNSSFKITYCSGASITLKWSIIM